MRLPSGVICFVSLSVPEVYRRAILEPNEARAMIDTANGLIQREADGSGGSVLREMNPEGGSVLAFTHVATALECAAQIQAAISRLGLPATMGVTTRDVEADEGGYSQRVEERFLAIRSSAAEGQIVVDLPTRELAVALHVDDLQFIPLGSRVVEKYEGSEKLYQLLHGDLQRDFPVPPDAMTPGHSLPAALTSFIGRWDVVERLVERYYFSRVVSIVGPGGVGKTRIAIQVGHEMVPRQPDGVWFVDLSSVRDGRLIADAIYEAVPWSTSQVITSTVLATQIGDRQTLLILDNIEHLVGEVAQVVVELTSRCPNLVVLVTSRKPLHIEGESVHALEPLSVPHPRAGTLEILASESVSLVLDRLRVQDPDYEPSTRDLRQIAELVALADGIPLALELVAARYRPSVGAQLLKSLRTRVSSLSHEARLPSERHRRLSEVLEWGYSELDPQVQGIFHQLAVFSGGFTLASAAAVCGEAPMGDSEATVAQALQILTDFSLIVRAGDRYRMLGPTQEVALQKLASDDGAARARNRHLDWLLSWAEPMSQDDALRPDLLAQAEIEKANIGAGFEWGLSARSDDRAARLAYALAEYWFGRGHSRDGLLIIRRVLRSSRRLEWRLKCRLHNWKGILAMDADELSEAIEDFLIASRLAARHGERQMETKLLANLAIAYRRSDRLVEAHELGKRLLAQMTGEDSTRVQQEINVATTAIYLERFDEAERHLDAAAAILKTAPSDYSNTHLAFARGSLKLGQDRLDEAQELFERSLVQFAGLQDLRGLALSLGYLVVAVSRIGLFRQATVYYGCFAKLAETVVLPLGRHSLQSIEDAVARCREALGSEFESEAERGAQLDLADLAGHLRERLVQETGER